ncbi:ABC transporter permease subunit [Streptomyces broussonetiae]|uniref:ABC transporter permease subunit n=1 Tax=Streptomyces broussonetiae TaxID=2686304 RepID=A0ABV5ECW6_9ACTN
MSTATAIYQKSLSDSRRSLVGWVIGCAFMGMAYASAYPSQKNNLDNIPQNLRDSMNIDNSAAGYLNAAEFGLVLPLLLLIYAIAAGHRATAGDEEAGQLDLVLAHPVTRTQLMLQRFANLVTGAFVISFVVWLALLAVRGNAELTSISPAQFLAQCLGLALLASTFGALAVALGAATGRRTVVLAGTAAVAVVTYALHTMAEPVGADWLAYLSPFHYYIGGEPLRNGFQWTDYGVLVVLTAVCLAVGASRFNRRDINS